MALVCYAAAALSSPAKPSPPLRTRFSIGRPAPSSAAGQWSTPRRRTPNCSVLCCTGVVADAASQAAQTLRHVCGGRVPDHILDRAEEIGFTVPTEMQRQSLPVLLSGRDCVLHAQTGSGKTLAYLLLIFSLVDAHKFAVQALIVVPSRELGMQVTKVARLLAAKPAEDHDEKMTCTVMALLDGGLLKRHKGWLKAEPPQIIVATIGSLCLMHEKQILKLEKLRVLVVDEVDFLFNSSKQAYSVRKLLTLYSANSKRQTVFASASIPQHNRFIHDCIQQKWTKSDVVHVHVNPVEPMPSRVCHKFLICSKKTKLNSLVSLVMRNASMAGIIFVNEQSEKSKKAGNLSPTFTVTESLRNIIEGLEIILLEEEMNFNARASSLMEVRQGGSLLVATDIIGRGVDLPDTRYIYNFDLPKTAISYLHRAGRTCRRPFSGETCTVINLITPEERFVLQKFENELMFQCEEIFLNWNPLEVK